MPESATVEILTCTRAVCTSCDWTGRPSHESEPAVAERDAHNRRYHPRGGAKCDMCGKRPAKVSKTMRNGIGEPSIVCAKCDKKMEADAQVGLKALFG